MIGQQRLQQQINEEMSNKTFPQFAIFVGEEGCGKKTLMEELVGSNWEFWYICRDVKVDTIREMIAFAQGNQSRCAYVIPDAQDMSLQSKNSILKLVEEPHRNATFLMSITSEDDLLGTIKSRGRIYRFDTYTDRELKSVVTRQDALDSKFIVDVANTIDDVLKLNLIDLDEFRKQINVILDKADTLSIGNLLKSSKNMAFKDSDEGINLKLYLQGFEAVALERLKQAEDDDVKMYRDIIIETSSKLNDLKIKSVNRQMLYEIWLLNIREIREKYGYQ